MTGGRRRGLAAAVAVLGLLTACGIPPASEAHQVQPPKGPYSGLGSPSPAPSPTGQVPELLFLVKDGLLVPVRRQVPSPPTVNDLMHDLLAGPTDTEQSAGINSALPGANVIGDVTVVDRVALVDLATAPLDTGRNDAILSYGQVVCTLDARPDILGVLFRQDGEQVDVPNADGALVKVPLTAADYAGILAPS